MTGEELASFLGPSPGWCEPPAIQPGQRPPAPGDLALVQSFINSHYDLEFRHGADLFATPGALTDWLTRRGLLTGGETGPAPVSTDLERALTVREGLRTLAGLNGDARARPGGILAALDEAAHGVAIEVRFAHDGPRFVPVAARGLDRALAVVLAVTAAAMIDGSWARLKVCPGEHCGWAFYDHSRNQSGQWCSMAVCGARAKARAYYRRRRGMGD
jgi:predicted RNA-binding Zn ribbon-like protein